MKKDIEKDKWEGKKISGNKKDIVKGENNLEKDIVEGKKNAGEMP